MRARCSITHRLFCEILNLWFVPSPFPRLLYKIFGHLRTPNAQEGISIETVAVIVYPAFWIDSTRSSCGHFGDAFPRPHLL